MTLSIVHDCYFHDFICLTFMLCFIFQMSDLSISHLFEALPLSAASAPVMQSVLFNSFAAILEVAPHNSFKSCSTVFTRIFPVLCRLLTMVCYSSSRSATITTTILLEWVLAWVFHASKRIYQILDFLRLIVILFVHMSLTGRSFSYRKRTKCRSLDVCLQES